MHANIWEKTLKDIAESVDEHRYQTWFSPLRLADNTDQTTLVLVAPNRFVSDFLDQHYKERVLSLLRRHSSQIRDVSFVSSENAQPPTDPPREAKSTSPPPQRQSKQPPVRQVVSQPGLNKRFAFDSFVVGSGNEFAKSAALAVAEAPGKTKFNPLLIYGGVGLGKTHLLQAIGNYVRSAYPDHHVLYLTSEEFYLQFIDAIKNNNTKTFTSRYRTCDLLLVDDVQFFSGKESTQEEFFYTFNSLYQNGKQIVLTSDLPPATLKGLQDRLISRFQWGLCVDIQPPDLETRVAILKRKAEEDNLNIPENVLYYIGENVSSNIRELEGIIIRILAYASITKTDITIDLVKTIVKRSVQPEKARVSLDHVIQTVADFYKVPVNNIRDKNRRKEVAHCRQVAMYIAKNITNFSLKTIGLNFGGRDHSTVIHAIHQIDDLRKKDASLRRDIDYIINSLKIE